MASNVFLSVKERKDKNLYRESDNKVRCQYCEVFFTRNRDCIKHETNFHKIRRIFSCSECDKFFYSFEDLKSHSASHIDSQLSFRLYKSVFDGASQIFRKNLENEEGGDPSQILSDEKLEKEIINIIHHQVLKRKFMYFKIAVHAIFVKFTEHGDIQEKITFVSSSSAQKLAYTDKRSHFSEILRSKRKGVDDRFQDFTENGSGWTLIEVPFIDLEFSSLGDMRGGCFFKYPSRQGLLNIQSSDQMCLVYCVLAHFYGKSLPAQEKTKGKSYEKFLHTLNLEGIPFPMEPSEIHLLENRKHTTPKFQINVFTEDNDQIFPFRIAESIRDDQDEKVHRINVLLVQGEDIHTKEKIYHYILINSVSHFLRKKYHGCGSYTATVSCQFCLASFWSEDKKNCHEKWCQSGKKTILDFEKDQDKKIKYTKFWNGFPHLLCGFVDFESILKKEAVHDQKTCDSCLVQNNSLCEHAFTLSTHVHKAINYCFIVVDRNNKVRFQKVYTGEDACQNFIQTLLEKEKFFRYLISEFQEMDFTEVDQDKFSKSQTCYLCGKDFIDSDLGQKGIKVRDHCHITGKYLGAAHQICNLNRSEKSVMKIFAHNFSGYDSHLIIPYLNEPGVRDIQVIPKSSEKFSAIFINKFYGLLDSMAFLAGSLDSLINSLPEDHSYSILKQSTFVKTKVHHQNAFKVLFQKWKFPYELAQSIEDLENMTDFPEIDSFFNTLRGETISQEDHASSLKLFKMFNFNNMREYLEVYCLLDVFLLAEVFTLFRKQTLGHFGVDPNNYISLPGLGLDCFLKKTGVTLDYVYSGNLNKKCMDRTLSKFNYIPNSHTIYLFLT